MPYTLPSGIILPSVTEIINATQTRKQKRLLEKWQQANPGAGESAASRGNQVHLLCSDYLSQPFPRQFPNLQTCPESIQPYFTPLVPFLSECGPSLWVEQQVNGPHQFVYSHLGYAGRPDWLVAIRSKYVLVDLKTSDKPYHATYKGDGGAYAKFCKAATQLAAYRIAVIETLSITPDYLMVLVAQPDNYQVLTLTPQQMTQAEERWNARLAKYKKIQQ